MYYIDMLGFSHSTSPYKSQTFTYSLGHNYNFNQSQLDMTGRYTQLANRAVILIVIKEQHDIWLHCIISFKR